MVSMVVPTYNERERLEHFVRALAGVLPAYKAYATDVATNLAPAS